MSKYTTEVRYICEEAAGLAESVGEKDAYNVVQIAYPKIFSPDLTFHNETIKTRLLPKILLHYYTREIGFETAGLWKLKINQKLREILPYYNQLYASEELEYDPLKNVDNTHTHEGAYEDNSKVDNIKAKTNLETRDLTTVDDGSSSFEKEEITTLRHDKTVERDNDTVSRGDDTTSHIVDHAADRWTLFSDTPQGGINGVQNGGGVSASGTLSDNAYLTNATHETESPTQSHDTTQFGTVTNTYGEVVETYNKHGDKHDTFETDGWEKTDNTNTHTGTIDNTGRIVDDNRRKNDGTDSYTKHETGKIGVLTYQEMVNRYRDTFLNIDMQIIDELDDLFLKVW